MKHTSRLVISPEAMTAHNMDHWKRVALSGIRKEANAEGITTVEATATTVEAKDSDVDEVDGKVITVEADW